MCEWDDVDILHFDNRMFFILGNRINATVTKNILVS